MPPHSIKLLIVKTERVVLAGLSISHYLSRREVLPAHTSAGLDTDSDGHPSAAAQLYPTTITRMKSFIRIHNALITST